MVRSQSMQSQIADQQGLAALGNTYLGQLTFAPLVSYLPQAILDLA
jgi:hypothetical protein